MTWFSANVLANDEDLSLYLEWGLLFASVSKKVKRDIGHDLKIAKLTYLPLNRREEPKGLHPWVNPCPYLCPYWDKNVGRLEAISYGPCFKERNKARGLVRLRCRDWQRALYYSKIVVSALISAPDTRITEEWCSLNMKGCAMWNRNRSIIMVFVILIERYSTPIKPYIQEVRFRAGCFVNGRVNL